jgi:hypothetical protein
MNAQGILLLSSANRESCNFHHSFIRGIVSSGGHFIDYHEIYLQYGIKQSEEYIKKYIDDQGIGILLYCSAAPWQYHFSVEFFRDMREKITVAMYFTDCDYYFEQRDRYYGQAADLVFTMDPISPCKFKQLEIPAQLRFPFYDSAEFLMKPGMEKSIDVSFVGLIDSKIGRQEYCRHLASGNINVQVFGASVSERIPQEQMVEVFNKSRINLNFTGGGQRSDYAVHRLIRQNKGRNAEITLSGGFLLCEYASGIEELFDVGKEIDVFNTKEELLEKTRYYLNNPAQREAMAERGYKRALREYSLDAALPKMITALQSIKRYETRNRREICLDDVFIRKFASYRILWFILFLKMNKWALAFKELWLALSCRKFQWLQVREYVIQETIDKFPKTKSFLKSIFRIKSKPASKYYV